MTRDASLGDFGVGDEASDEGDEATSGDARATSTEQAQAGDEPAPVSPAVSTYCWEPTGRDCGTCGESVERLWRDGPEFVCESCKEW
ncbi:DUF7573 domain-containing protein [Haloarchaeobius sp. DFWS5]|uniref:DUF7573 domain-containing protein n=1 Tax=Haloarchaeobius sp. DFWS5 TaxID=3446114 RepID=UPI003EB99A86